LRSRPVAGQHTGETASGDRSRSVFRARSYASARRTSTACPIEGTAANSGQRTGKYRVGVDRLITDAQGNSRISAEDYAAAVLDEVERPQHVRQLVTAAY
jgi:hypothetical protein